VDGRLGRCLAARLSFPWIHLSWIHLRKIRLGQPRSDKLLPGPELSQYKLQVLLLVSLRGQQAIFSLSQLHRSCTEKFGRL